MINNDLKKEKNEEKQGERRYLKDEGTGMIGQMLLGKELQEAREGTMQ